ncbi:Flp pilus assembly protein CpaB [Kineosporia sp. J2-2]|uniref:Flp pilus assembly protein CpaB n=1 Tax=Kineosporia corallincola TaxID=2835133 RepID=A0ABS5THY3_9ACTN|nr:Flp pilus assembly protein CpaB [Kineosporia corallincola]MBT0770690.1 Flp pilus assembly protein CpaB [Kineosporia corallincola]
MLLLAMVWVTVRAASPSAVETTPVIVAARDLAAGHRIAPGDVQATAWPAAIVPPAAMTVATDAVVGGSLAGPLHRGELLTDARVLGPGLLRGLPTGTVAVPVRVSDPAGASLVRGGDHVDVLVSTANSWSAKDGDVGSGSGATSSERAVRNALVLSVSGVATGSGAAGSGAAGTGAAAGSGIAGMAGGWGGSGTNTDDDESVQALSGVLVLAVHSSEADRLAAATVGASVSVAVLP